MARNNIYPPSVTPGIPRLGKRPKGWREVAFSDILEVVQRPADVRPDQKYQLINAKRNRGGIVPRARLLGKQIRTKTQFYVAVNDFVISRRQIVHGACGIVPQELDGALVSNEYSTLVPKDGLLLAYMGYLCHSVHFQQTCFHSSVGVAVEKMVFKLEAWLRHRLYLPPIEYQRKAVDLLATTDRTIDRTADLIEAKRTFKKGLAQQLLTGQKRLPGFGEPVEDGELPSGWTVAHLKDSARFRGGIGFPESDQGTHPDGIPFIKVSDMSRAGNSKFIDGAANSVSPEVANERGWKTFPPGSVVFAKVGAALLLNRRRILRTPTLIDNNLLAAIPKQLTTSEFLYLLLLRLDLGRLVNVGAVPSVNQSQIGSVIIFLPSLDEQACIAAVLGAADRGIALLENKLAALHELKRGLMQKLLSHDRGL